MSKSLREEIAYGLAETFALDMSNPKSIEYATAYQEADRALALIESRLPEQKAENNKPADSGVLAHYWEGNNRGFNACLTEVKLILKGTGDESN